VQRGGRQEGSRQMAAVPAVAVVEGVVQRKEVLQACSSICHVAEARYMNVEMAMAAESKSHIAVLYGLSVRV